MGVDEGVRFLVVCMFGVGGRLMFWVERGEVSRYLWIL